MATLDITQVLNTWAEYGVFSYVFPFLIIFSIVFAILQKTQLFGNAKTDGQKNVNGINAIIAVSVAFISLLNDYVSTFFATIFPRFGIALAIFLVLLILIGFFYKPDPTGKNPASLSWIGWVLGLGVVLWAWSEWNNLYGVDNWGVTYFLEEYFWGLILIGAIGGLIYWIVKKD
jgi:hypothetical protein